MFSGSDRTSTVTHSRLRHHLISFLRPEKWDLFWKGLKRYLNKIEDRQIFRTGISILVGLTLNGDNG